ncbi:hypothetical protein C8Q74DRAFT_833951 [Fomes fomentarius]|nr:hypothetical protein C8Q74DRAFT_833951 [Fomes fomentarius]
MSMLLADGSQLHDNVIASRLARATMPLLAIILSKRSQSKEEEEEGSTQGRSKKGKKRGRGYEGDEVFKVGREVVCLTASDGDVLLASVDVLESLLYRTPVNPPVHSIATRLFLSIYASLPQMPPTLLSPDRTLHTRLSAKVQRVCVHLTIGTTSTLSKSLGLVLSVSDGQLVNDDVTVAAEVELLLHPRVPPLVRSLPHVEALSLFRAEEGEDEIDVRRRTGLAVPDEPDVAPGAVTEGPTLPVVGQVSTSSSPTDAAKRTGELLVDMQVDSPTPTFGSTPPLQPSQALWSPPQTQLSGVSEQPAHDATGTLSATTKSSPPPPPDLLPSYTVTMGQQPSRTAIPAVTPGPTPRGEEDDDDEPMPPIDLSSDSDSD